MLTVQSIRDIVETVSLIPEIAACFEIVDIPNRVCKCSVLKVAYEAGSIKALAGNVIHW